MSENLQIIFKVMDSDILSRHQVNPYWFPKSFFLYPDTTEVPPDLMQLLWNSTNFDTRPAQLSNQHLQEKMNLRNYSYRRKETLQNIQLKRKIPNSENWVNYLSKQQDFVQ